MRGRDLEGVEVVVRADGRLPYGEVRDVLEMLAVEGVREAALATDRVARDPHSAG